MDNLRTAMIIFHSLTLAIILYFSSFLLTARFDSSSDKTIFITLGILILVNSILRISVLSSYKNKKRSKWILMSSLLFRCIQFLVTGLLIVDMFMRNIGSLEKSLIYILVINAILAIIFWTRKDKVGFPF